jgi:hypothetical protein
MPALKTEMNQVLDSFVNRVFALFISGNNITSKTGQNPICIWLSAGNRDPK